MSVDLLKIPEQPDGRSRAKAQLGDGLVSQAEGVAQLNRIVILGFVANESLLFDFFMLWKGGETVSWELARPNGQTSYGAGHSHMTKSSSKWRIKLIFFWYYKGPEM